MRYLSWLRARFASRRAGLNLRLAQYWRARGDLDEAARHADRALRLVSEDGTVPDLVAVEAAILAAEIACDRTEYAAAHAGLLGATERLNSLRHTVARDRLVVVVHPTHPWARRRKALSIAELALTPLLAREPGSGTRTTLDVALQEYDRAAPLLELGSAAAIRTSVLAGVGPAVMSTLAVAEQVAAGELKVVDVDGLELDRVLRAVWRGARQLDGPAGELVRLVRRVGAEN